MQVEETITTGTATTATADDAIANVHELVLCQARGKGATMLRESYEARLRTFSPLQYFAKPACLSPLVCARLGFRNVATNMLQCTACQAALEIDIPSSLSAPSRLSMTRQLEQQLETVHGIGCRFRHDAVYYFGAKKNKEKNDRDENAKSNDDDDDDDELVPMVLSQVFRPETMELLDPPLPQTIVRKRCRNLFELSMSKKSRDLDTEKATESTASLEAMPIPKPLLEYGAQAEEGPEHNMLFQVAERLFESDDDNNIETFQDKQLAAKALALVVLGWTPIDAGDLDPNICCQLECKICWSRYPLAAAEDKTSSPRPPAKRARTAQRVDALQAHRHYCPFVCGFPRATDNHNQATAIPLWQSLLERLHSADATTVSTTTTTPSRVEIFQMLQSGVSRQKLAL